MAGSHNMNGPSVGLTVREHIERKELTERFAGLEMVGRARELADLGRLTESHRVVAVTGHAGVGKTRLIAEWLRTSHQECPVVYRDLSHRQGTNWPWALVESGSAEDILDFDSCLEHLRRKWSKRRAVFWLDSCEALGDRIASLQILGSILPNAQIVLGTRTIDHLWAGLCHVEVAPLATFAGGPAEQLVASIVGWADPRLRSLTLQTHGLPLAIRIAGDLDTTRQHSFQTLLTSTVLQRVGTLPDHERQVVIGTACWSTDFRKEDLSDFLGVSEDIAESVFVWLRANSFAHSVEPETLILYPHVQEILWRHQVAVHPEIFTQYLERLGRWARIDDDELIGHHAFRVGKYASQLRFALDHALALNVPPSLCWPAFLALHSLVNDQCPATETLLRLDTIRSHADWKWPSLCLKVEFLQHHLRFEKIAAAIRTMPDLVHPLDGGDPELSARFGIALASYYRLNGATAKASALCQDVLTYLPRVQPHNVRHHLRSKVEWVICLVKRLEGVLDEASDHARIAEQSAAQAGAPHEEWKATQARALIEMDRGNFAQALEMTNVLCSRAALHRNTYWHTQGYALAATALLLDGRTREAIAASTASWEVGQELGAVGWRTDLAVSRLVNGALSHNSAVAAEGLKAVEALWDEVSAMYGASRMALTIAGCLVLVGRQDLARRLSPWFESPLQKALFAFVIGSSEKPPDWTPKHSLADRHFALVLTTLAQRRSLRIARLSDGRLAIARDGITNQLTPQLSELLTFFLGKKNSSSLEQIAAAIWGHALPLRPSQRQKALALISSLRRHLGSNLIHDETGYRLDTLGLDAGFVS